MTSEITIPSNFGSSLDAWEKAGYLCGYSIRFKASDRPTGSLRMPLWTLEWVSTQGRRSNILIRSALLSQGASLKWPFPTAKKVRPQEIVMILRVCDKNVSHVEKSQRVGLKQRGIGLRMSFTFPKLSAS
jgi:hypothetical protein